MRIPSKFDLDQGNPCKKIYIGWPLLLIENLYKHYPKTEDTPKGNLNQARQNVHSSKPTATPPPTTDDATLSGKMERDVYYKVYEAKNKTYSDQTVRFPVNPQRWYKYIMVVVEVYTNATLVTPLKNSNGAKMQQGYIALLSRIRATGVTPKCHILDNECSDSMKTLIR